VKKRRSASLRLEEKDVEMRPVKVAKVEEEEVNMEVNGVEEMEDDRPPAAPGVEDLGVEVDGVEKVNGSSTSTPTSHQQDDWTDVPRSGPTIVRLGDWEADMFDMLPN
jgi:hypothetical protein